MANITPLAYYHEQCKKNLIKEDPNQLQVLHYLNIIHQQLLYENSKRKGILSSLRKPRLIKGLYVWGEVGIGKTFLMDCFFATIPFAEKKRIHFHLFMQFIHRQLKQYQGKKNPLKLLAKHLAKNTMLLCFDELAVTDITDAMLLGQLFKNLFAEGICLVATSNVKPDDLYKNGLQRKLFLPTIELLKKHTTVLHLPSLTDYRTLSLKNMHAFYSSNDETAETNIEKIFKYLSKEEPVTFDPILINDRLIPVKKVSINVAWFDFQHIAKVPRSQADYIEISKLYHTVIITNVPAIAADDKNTISLFIRLIDVLYDAKIRLVLSSAVPVENIYEQGIKAFEFARTRSRLIEMLSEEYFKKDMLS